MPLTSSAASAFLEYGPSPFSASRRGVAERRQALEHQAERQRPVKQNNGIKSSLKWIRLRFLRLPLARRPLVQRGDGHDYGA